MFILIVSKVAIIFILLFIGALSRYKNILTRQATRDLSRVVIEITLPCLYFSVLASQFNYELFKRIWHLPLFAIGLVGIAYFLGWLLSRFLNLNSSQKNTFLYMSTFTNYGFLAIPIAFALLGDAGVVRIIIFNIGFSVLLWTLGIYTLAKGENLGKINLFKTFFNNGMIGLILGFIVGITAIKVPLFILNASSLLGRASIPLALLIIGAVMAGNFGDKRLPLHKPLFFLVGLRLIIMPLLALILLKAMPGISQVVCVIIVLQAAMPSSSATPLFVERFGGDAQLATSGVFITTLLSIITVPVFISLALALH